MPRYLQKTASIKKRSELKESYNIRQKQSFFDPFAFVHGTLPEKMVYAELTRLGIPFLFLNELRFEIPEIDFDKWYQADFVIPSAKIIIEVQGAYWHSMPDTIDADAFKFAVYEALGYKVLAWWDYDILRGVLDLIIKEPMLLALAGTGTLNSFRSTELPVQRRTKQDTSKGIRTLNARRKTGTMLKSRLSSVRKARK